MNTYRVSIRSAVATALFAAARMAAAAETAPAGEGKLEEVIVTAQKRTERLLDVPVAVTAVSSESLTKENMVSIIDYFSRIPSLQYNCRQTYCLSLRGLTTGDATNPTLAILVDDVPFGSALQAGLGNSRFPDLDPSTLDSIEVLRGPQGTLYGASTIGGLIKYVTRPPQTDEFSARVEAGVAAVDGGATEWNARGSLNVPFWSDRAAFSVSGFDRHDPAYMDNIQPGFEGKDVNDTHIYGGSASLLLKLTDDLSVTLSALRQKRDAEFTTSVQSLPTQRGLPPTYVPRDGEDNLSLTTTADVGNQELYTARIEWNIGDAHLTSITGYGQSSGTNVQDLSSIFFFIPLFYGFPPGSGAVVNINDIADTSKFSQEFRLSGKAGSLDWLVGLFYTDEDGTIDQTLTLFDPSGAQVAVVFDGQNPMTYKEKAVFTDVTWHVSSQWDLKAGVRYATNDQTNQAKQVIDDALPPPVFGVTGSGPKLASNDSATTFEISPTYHFNPDLMAYFRVASGYRPGGPNTSLPGVPASFDPDEVVNYELGLKGLTASQTFSFDLALFQINWTDIQLQDTDAKSQFTYTTNGGKAVSRGLEAAIQFRPLDGMTIGANATWLNAKLSEDLPTPAEVDTLVGEDGDRLPGSAEFSANASISQVFNLTSSLSASVGANVSYVGARKSEFVNSAALLPPDKTLAERFDLPDYTQVDLRAGLSTTSGWHLDAYARNVTNEDGVVFANNRNGTNTTIVAFLQPLTYGITLSKDF